MISKVEGGTLSLEYEVQGTKYNDFNLWMDDLLFRDTKTKENRHKNVIGKLT